MVMPLDAITVIHNAFRRDLTEIDEAVYKVARHGGDLSPLVDRLQWFSQILDMHAKGEEDAVFPAVDKVAPLVAPLFVTDHREMDIMCTGLEQVVGAPDELAAARAAAVLHSHVRIHLAKEDAHLYPILRERISARDQAPIVGQMASKVPPELTPQFTSWLFALVSQDDRVTMTTVWKAVMPEEVFAGVKQLIQGAVRRDDWSDLTRRVPGLA